MTRIRKVVSAVTLSMTLAAAGVAVAQDHHGDDHHGGGHGDHYVRHDDWRNGGHIGHDDWNRGQHIDYRHYHLNAPPRGYEWRQVDGNYVLAAAATGLIASVIVASTVH